MGYPSVVWQQQMEKAIINTYNNSHLYQKPIPVWDPDYKTTFTTHFRPIPLIDDYNPIISIQTMAEIPIGTLRSTTKISYNS